MPNLSRMLIAAAMTWHLCLVFAHYKTGHKEQHGRDFASYYYAIQVAAEGGDPYRKSNLGEAAREDTTRRMVYPYFYPPPFLLGVVWTLPLDMVTAYRTWFWLNELAFLLAGLVLWRWWRPLGPVLGITLAVAMAAHTGLPNNHLMGQANLPVLLAVVLALWMERRDRPLLAGAAMGLACMWKMSPALFVAWWLLRGRYKAAFASVGAAVLLSVLTLPLVPLETQLRFYTDVLPGFSSGDYNGLSVGIDIFGNHSAPNVWDSWFPDEDRPHLTLSGTARLLSLLSTLGIVGTLTWAFRRPPRDLLSEAGQVGAVGVAMLTVPVITYEHHLIWALPAVAAVVLAVQRGRLSSRWVLPIGMALALWCFELQQLKEMYLYVRGEYPLLGFAIREAKFMALLVLLAAAAVVGASEAPEDPETA